MDLAPYYGINPCGFTGLQVTQMLELTESAPLLEVSQILVQELSKQLELQAKWNAELPSALILDPVSV